MCAGAGGLAWWWINNSNAERPTRAENPRELGKYNYSIIVIVLGHISVHVYTAGT